MNSLAKQAVNCTNSIIISDIKIHMDAEGRYSLNDLHKASGYEQRHRPKYWLELNQTTELIEEILKGGIPPFKSDETFNSVNVQDKKPVDSKKGRYGGTYVCKELVYSYAMWVSAAFALKIIRAYDALVAGNVDLAVRIAKTTVNERTPLRDAVNLLVGKKGLRYDDAYNMVHQRFNIDSIDELALEQIPMAVEYVHRIALEGEFLGKQLELPMPTLDINYPAEWWDQFPLLQGDRKIQKSISAGGFQFPVRLLYGFADESPSAISDLISKLAIQGYDMSAVKMEYLAHRHYAERMYQKLSRITEISGSVLGSSITLNIGPSIQA